MISKVFNLNLLSSVRLTGMKGQGKFNFSEKSWKERDEAAEKVYITQAQKQTMKKLLSKINEQGYNFDNKTSEQHFEKKLDEILAKHKVTNQAFKVEVLHLHKQL